MCHTPEEFGHSGVLGHESVRSVMKGGVDEPGAAVGGKDQQSGGCVPASDPFEELQAGDIRERYVQYDQIGIQEGESFQEASAVYEFFHQREALLSLHDMPETFSENLVVFNQNDFCLFSHGKPLDLQHLSNFF